MNEEEIRADERAKIAQELLAELDRVGYKGRVLQPGLWHAATILDPRVNEGFRD